MEYPQEYTDARNTEWVQVKPDLSAGKAYVGLAQSNAKMGQEAIKERTLFEGAATRLAQLQSVIEDTGGALENVNNRVLGAVPTSSAGQTPVRAGAPTALGDALLANLDDLINIAVRVREDAYRLNRSL